MDWYVLLGERMDGVLGFMALYGIVYVATIGVMLATGATVIWLNVRYPERRIQQRRSAKTVRDDLRTAMVPLAITSLCLTVGLFAQAKGWTMVPWPISWWSVPLIAIALLVLQDAWFYWTHRALHTRWFARFHRRHHLNLAPTVFSSDDSGIVDTLFAHTFYALIVFVLPVHPIILIIHRMVDQVSGMIGHCGFEHFASPSTRWPAPLLCTVFHDQHHEHYRYNYGIYTSFWDRVCGTLHVSYDGKAREFEAICASSAKRGVSRTA